jgi:hypothetical protein
MSTVTPSVTNRIKIHFLTVGWKNNNRREELRANDLMIFFTAQMQGRTEEYKAMAIVEYSTTPDLSKIAQVLAEFWQTEARLIQQITHSKGGRSIRPLHPWRLLGLQIRQTCSATKSSEWGMFANWCCPNLSALPTA